MTEHVHDDGGPAFPCHQQVTLCNDAGETDSLVMPGNGITLRDWFAGQALAGLLAAAETDGLPREFACVAYNMADAMLRERKDRT